MLKYSRSRFRGYFLYRKRTSSNWLHFSFFFTTSHSFSHSLYVGTPWQKTSTSSSLSLQPLSSAALARPAIWQGTPKTAKRCPSPALFKTLANAVVSLCRYFEPSSKLISSVIVCLTVSVSRSYTAPQRR